MTQTFDQWMRSVNAAIEAAYGLTADDLPDYGYADAYADGVPPRTAAARAIRAAGDF